MRSLDIKNPQNVVFQFSVVWHNKRMEEYFPRKMILPPMEENNFHFEKIGSWFSPFNSLTIWAA